MFGSVGWVASGIFSVIAFTVMHLSAFDDTNLPMYCGAAVCFMAALLNLRLPHTPPSVDKSAGISVMDITGFSAFSLMKDKNYRFLCILTFLGYHPVQLVPCIWFDDSRRRACAEYNGDAEPRAVGRNVFPGHHHFYTDKVGD